MREADTQREIIDYLERIAGFIVIRTKAGKIYHKGGWIKLAAKGTSDLVACSSDGRFWAIEIKDGAPIKQEQLDFLESIRERGGVAEIVRGIKDLKKILTTYLT